MTYRDVYKRAAFRGFLVWILFALVLVANCDSVRASLPVYPVTDKNLVRSLNGAWSFKYIPALDAGADSDFAARSFDASAWKSIHVPSNWELQGFADPQYDLKLKDGLGLYRRAFRVPESWKGNRICLRFEGVLFGFEVWVNGTKVGASDAGAYNPHTFDITDSLLPSAGADNMLAVKVATKPLGYEFDVNDDWSLSGIYRDVTLFAVPETHVTDLATHTKLGADGSATLSVDVALSQPGELHVELRTASGELVRGLELSRQSDGRYRGEIKVAQPLLWTAETPWLYKLTLRLGSASVVLQSFEREIGLREVSIVDGVLRLNGVPLKLRGVNRHDLSPDVGRAVTEEHMRRDLALMKAANVNFVRTSHYAPHPRFVELCDELGFYVMCEVAIGKGEEHLQDPKYRDNILRRVEATLTRDKNHPSVIVWSIGNENPVTPVEEEACRLAKKLDPTRPICIPKIGSYFAKNYERIPALVDIYSPHYPDNTTVAAFGDKLTRPVIFTEYAHALGLATDRIQDQWELMQAKPRLAGGAVWHFMDQGILRRSAKPVDRGEPTNYAWLDSYNYYDTNGTDGVDGIVYADRVPQTDYWQLRKVYAPVQIVERSVRVGLGAQELTLNLQNRFDFLSLKGARLDWKLRKNGAEMQSGSVALTAAPQRGERVKLGLKISADAADNVMQLDLECVASSGSKIVERSLRLDMDGAARNGWLDRLPAREKARVTETPGQILIECEPWTAAVSKASGSLTLADRSGRALLLGIYPHGGRIPTMAEKNRAKGSDTWQGSLLAEGKSVAVTATQTDGAVLVRVSGTYPRPEAPEQSFVGGYEARILSCGSIAIRYEYAPTGAKGNLLEAGLSLVLPSAMTEFRWLGQGPYAGYPGKDRLNEFGLFHLNREDLRFQGNRREVDLALLTTPAGEGVALAADKSDVAVERFEGSLLLSHNALVAGLGNKFTRAETAIDAAKVGSFRGGFVLVPLGTEWPETLERWFGRPVGASDVFRPFYHSYDQ